MEVSAPKRRKLSLTNGEGSTQGDQANGSQASDYLSTLLPQKSLSQPSTSRLAPFDSTLTPTGALPRSLQRRNSAGQTELRRNKTLGSELGGNKALSSRARSMEPLPPGQDLTYANGKHNGDSNLSAVKRGLKRTKGVENTPVKARRMARSDLRASSPERLEADGDESDHVLSNGTLAKEANGASNSKESDISSVETGGHHILTTPKRSSGITFGMSIGEDGEPSLPSTPVQLGLEKPPQPPRGLSSSSPRRRDRKKATGVSKSSPLKNRWDASADPGKGLAGQRPELGPRIFIAHTPRPPPSSPQCIHDDLARRLLEMEEHLKSLADELVHGLLVCGKADRHDQEPRISKAINKTQMELSVVVGKVLRLRNFIRQSRNGAETTSDAQCVKRESSTHPLPIGLAQQLARLLPFSEKAQPEFSKLLHNQPKKALQPSAPAPIETDIRNANIACYNTHLLDGMQKESICLSQMLSFSFPCDSLRCEIRAIINVMSKPPYVENMTVLELSTWAEAELGVWLRSPSRSTSLEALGQSIRNYWSACQERLQCFTEAAQAFGSVVMVAHYGDSHADLQQGGRNADNGRQKLSFTRDGVSLDVNWQITFTDGGQTTNIITAQPTFPETWEHTQNASELGKVGGAFKALLGKNGAAYAIRAIAGLMFPE